MNQDTIDYLNKYKRNAYTIADFYLSYLSNIEEDTVYDVEFDIFKLIVSDYLKHLSYQLLDQSRQLKLPARLGTFEIVKRKPKTFTSKSLRVDFQETKRLGKTIFHLNEHSNYYKFRLYWSKKDSHVMNNQYYQFILTRDNKRHLAYLIKNNKQDYIEIK